MPPLFRNAIFLAAVLSVALRGIAVSHAGTGSPETEDSDSEIVFPVSPELDGDDGFEAVDTDSAVEDVPFKLPNDFNDSGIDESDVKELIHHPDDGDFEDREFIRGDFDRDGALDLTKDLRLLREQIESDTPDMSYDLDRDGEVGLSDITYWVERIRGRLIGDLNLDNKVDSSDFVDAHKFGKYNTGEEADWSMGDVNGDRVFDTLDEKLIHMSGHYEAKRSPRRSAAASVPEPIFLSLVGMGLVFMLLAYTALQGQRQQKRAEKN